MENEILRSTRSGRHFGHEIAGPKPRREATPDGTTPRNRRRRSLARANLCIACFAAGGLAALLSVEEARHEMEFQAHRLIATLPTPEELSLQARHQLAAQNCDATRAMGLAPARRGEPGYWPHLDRDNDGVACEPR